jgi:hypothetical protein
MRTASPSYQLDLSLSGDKPKNWTLSIFFLDMCLANVDSRNFCINHNGTTST